MKTLRLLSILAATSLLTLSACTKDEQPGNEDDDNADDGEDDNGTADGSDFGDDGDDGMFIPNDGDVASTPSCDPWAQDCPDDEKCVAYASSGGTWDANKCVPVSGDGASGDSCTYTGAVESTDDCDQDNWCWDVNEEGAGTCTPFCSGTADNPQCGGDTSCSIANNGSINLCLTTCDPLFQDCAVAGTACFWDGGSFVCAAAVGELPVGEACGFINDCSGGNVCLTAEVLPNCNGSSCCGEFCNLTDANCSVDGTECTDFFEEGAALPGYEDVGVCVIPG